MYWPRSKFGGKLSKENEYFTTDTGKCIHTSLMSASKSDSSSDRSVVQHWATGWMSGRSTSGRGWEFFSSPPSLLSSGY
jgi:hypothetical protein